MASVEDVSDEVMLEALLQFERNYCGSSDEDAAGKESCDDDILLQASLQFEHDLEQEDSRFVMKIYRDQYVILYLRQQKSRQIGV